MTGIPMHEGSLWRRYRTVALLIVLVSSLHYLTPHGNHAAHHAPPVESFNWNAAFHGIYRRLYYFPIILAGFRGGVRGGFGAALAVVAIYLPHAFARELRLDSVVIADPGMPAEKILEIMLYLAMGLLAGLLAERLHQTSQDLRRTFAEKTAVEEELVRSARLAAVGRLSAGLAHEIRNPLASIRGSAELLTDDYPADNSKRRLLDILLLETERLNTVLSRFLEFARQRPAAREELDLVAEARDVIALMANQKDIPPLRLEAPATCQALGELQAVRQILVNLVLNAAAVSPPQCPIIVQIRSTEKNAQIMIQDDGPGFSADALANFGTPFFSTREKGMGLGLAISLRAAEDMGGHLEVDRDFTTGARVVLTLPRSSTLKERHGSHPAD